MNTSNLMQILAAREERVRDQQELLKDGGVLVSFTLNIPGPVKQAVLYRYVFETGLARLRESLRGHLCKRKQENPGVLRQGLSEAGYYAYLKLPVFSGRSAEETAREIKKITVALEEEPVLGRLFDMDVLYSSGSGKGAPGTLLPEREGKQEKDPFSRPLPAGSYTEETEPVKVSRRDLGLPSRKCLVCEKSAFTCVRAARHPVSEVMMKVIDRILASEEIRNKILKPAETGGHAAACPTEDSYAAAASLPDEHGSLDPVVLEALRALLYEVITTPKPGLVDAENSGAHKDMSITAFFDSALVLVPYLQQCLEIGQKAGEMTERSEEDAEEPAGVQPEDMLSLLRPEGVRAERAMLEATDGINTHKGAVFTFGVLCCAAGWLRGKRGQDAEQFLSECRKKGMLQTAVEILGIAGRICSTLENGNTRFRAEVMQGYPSLKKALRELEPAAAEVSNDANVYLLLCLLKTVEDSNVVRRNGEEAGEKLKFRAAKLYREMSGPKHLFSEEEKKKMMQGMSELDRELIRENSSPGGAADLLAAGIFLRLLTESC